MKFVHLLFVVPSLASLVSCDLRPRREDKPVAPIMLELQQCGIDLGKANLVTKADEQYVDLEGHDRLSSEQAACVAAVLVPAKVGFRADNKASDELYGEAWQAAHRRFLAKEAREWFAQHRPDVELPKFQRAQQLETYLRLLEKACSAPKGTVLMETQHKSRYIRFARENPSDPNTDCVDRGLSIGLEGEDLGITRSLGYE